MAKMLGVKIDSGGEFVDKISGLVRGLPAPVNYAHAHPAPRPPLTRSMVLARPTAPGGSGR